MNPAILPGALFVLLMALAAWMNKDPDVVFILALACAVGWASQLEDTLPLSVRTFCWFVAIALWAAASILLLTRIFP